MAEENQQADISVLQYLHDDDDEYFVNRVKEGKVKVAKQGDEEIEIYFQVYGEGKEKLLLVMGLGGTHSIWLPNVKYLLERDDNLQICIFDNRGVGQSSVPSGRYKTSVMALEAIKVVDHLGWDKFHVAGISMGGMISQEIALAALDRVLTLNLSVTHSGGPGSFPPWAAIKGTLAANRLQAIEEKAPITMSLMYPPDFLSKKATEEKTFGDITTERYIRGATKMPPNPVGFRSQALAVQTHSVGKKRLHVLKKAQIPILISTGDTDNLVNPKASFYLKETLEPVEFVLWEKCGHAVLFQRFDEYNDSVLRHIKRNSILDA